MIFQKKQSLSQSLPRLFNCKQVGLFFLSFVLCLCISLHSFAQSEIFVHKITAEKRDELKKVLQENFEVLAPILGYKASIEETLTARQKIFSARTLSHKERLLQLFKVVMSDPQLKQHFPNLEKIQNQFSLAYAVVAVHDVGKADPRIANSIAVLSLLQGYNYRSPDNRISPELNKYLSTLLQEAIDDINAVDAVETENKLKDFSLDPAESSLLETLISVLDWYDTAISRQKELHANSKKSLISTANWIQLLRREGKLPEYAIANLGFALSLAHFLDFYQPLFNHSGLFAQEDDYLKTSDPQKEFLKRKTEILKSANPMRTSLTLQCYKLFNF